MTGPTRDRTLCCRGTPSGLPSVDVSCLFLRALFWRRPSLSLQRSPFRARGDKSSISRARSGPRSPGAAGLILRYVTHSPAPALAIAALPLMLTQIPVRVVGMTVVICLLLQWGRGPLTAPGPWALVFDLALATLAGLSLSAQWRARRSIQGARYRWLFLLAVLIFMTTLPMSVAVIGPLEPNWRADWVFWRLL